MPGETIAGGGAPNGGLIVLLGGGKRALPCIIPGPPAGGPLLTKLEMLDGGGTAGPVVNGEEEKGPGGPGRGPNAEGKDPGGGGAPPIEGGITPGGGGRDAKGGTD